MKGAHLFRLLRPEFCQNYYKPLNPDGNVFLLFLLILFLAFSSFLSESHRPTENEEIIEATQYLRTGIYIYSLIY